MVCLNLKIQILSNGADSWRVLNKIGEFGNCLKYSVKSLMFCLNLKIEISAKWSRFLMGFEQDLAVWKLSKI